MFSNIGGRIKILAEVFCVLGMIVSVLAGIFMQNFLGLFIALAGCVLSWIGSFVLYAYGEITDSLKMLADIAAQNEMERLEKQQASNATARSNGQ